jgi:putative ABC transport system permease protein
VLAAGIVSTFREVDELWKDADYAVTAQNNFSPHGQRRSGGEHAKCRLVGNVRQEGAGVRRRSRHGGRPADQRIFSIDWKETDAVLAQLGDDGSFVTEGFADDHDLAVGSPVELTFANGDRKEFVVRGIFEPPTGGSPFGPVTISAQTWDRFNEQPRNLFSFVVMAGGQTDANRAALERRLAEGPNAKVATRSEFIDTQISGLSSVLNILYVLLALSVVVSLFGIVNTLILTVFERTRESGCCGRSGWQAAGAWMTIAGAWRSSGLLVARVDFIDFHSPVVRWLSSRCGSPSGS